jgi:hypothetical protein
MKSTRTPWLVKLRPELEPKVVPALGPARQAERLKAEGHRVRRDGRKGWRVERN